MVQTFHPSALKNKLKPSKDNPLTHNIGFRPVSI